MEEVGKGSLDLNSGEHIYKEHIYKDKKYEKEGER